MKQNNQTSYYSEEFEKPNFTLEDSHDLLISWLVQEWEHRFKYSVEDSAKEHAERHFARIEYLIDRIKRKEGGGKELDEGKENKGRITKEKDDRKNNERDVAEKEEYKEEEEGLRLPPCVRTSARFPISWGGGEAFSIHLKNTGLTVPCQRLQ